SLEITASVSGFFVNGSAASFSPTPLKKHPLSHPTLVGLLELASPLFKTQFELLQQQISQRHPFEYVPAPFPSYPWCVKPQQHTADLARSLDAVFVAADIAETLSARDWNDDIQSALELPRDSAHDRVLRDQALVRAHTDFIEAAIRGAMAVVDKSIMAINPLEDEQSQMFIHNNIFFSQGYDNKETFDQYGGPEAAHVAVSKDINGIKAVQELDIEGIHTLGTVLIDYKGQRILAQSIVPGILKKNPGQESTIQYGSVDGGADIKSNEAFKEPASQVAKLLHLAEHELLDGQGSKHSLFTSVETKWVQGTDSRQYILDLYRTVPVDVQFLEDVAKDAETNPYPHKMTLLRNELVEQFYEFKLRTAIAAYQEEVQAQEKKLKEQGKEPPSVDEINKNFRFSFALNPDASTGVTSGASADDCKAEIEAVKEASGFISVVISQMVVEFVKAGSSIPLDSASLVKTFHKR
ncbi:hypothetical protein HDU91_002766, partial [Kappamyces sp. JEL0680]